MTRHAQLALEAPDPLYLFVCRLRCLRLGDLLAYEELKRAALHSDPNTRLVAEVFLAEIQAVQPRDATPSEDSWAGC